MGDVPSKSEDGADPHGRHPHMSSSTYQPWGGGAVDGWPHAAPPAAPPGAPYGGPTYGGLPPPSGIGTATNGWSQGPSPPGGRGMTQAYPPPGSGSYLGGSLSASTFGVAGGAQQLPLPIGYGGSTDAFGSPSPACGGGYSLSQSDWQRQQPRAAVPGPALRPAGAQQPAQQPTRQLTQQPQHSQPQLQDTLIIWDWDDTLMCSSAINANSMSPAMVPALEQLLEAALKIAMQCGETVIVTNADELWVLESARRFAPRARPLVQQLYDSGRVLSARRKYERACPGDVFAWKRETFREVVSAKRVAGGAGSSGGVNLVVLGDSPAEMEASQTSTVGVVPLLIKTVKFKESPTAEEVVEQLRMVCQDLPGIVSDDKTLSRNLAMNLRPLAPVQYAAPPPYVQSTYSATPVPYSASYGAGGPTSSYASSQAGYMGGGGGHPPPVVYAAGR